MRVPDDHDAAHVDLQGKNLPKSGYNDVFVVSAHSGTHADRGVFGPVPKKNFHRFREVANAAFSTGDCREPSQDPRLLLLRVCSESFPRAPGDR